MEPTGSGLLAVPVLAGAAAYAVGEAFRWPVGLSRKPKHAKAFYATLVVACILGMGILFTPVNPDHGCVCRFRLAAAAGLGLDSRNDGMCCWNVRDINRLGLRHETCPVGFSGSLSLVAAGRPPQRRRGKTWARRSLPFMSLAELSALDS